MAFAEMTIRSSVLDMDVKVNVILPEKRHHYELIEGKKYPVLYILHGYKEDNSSWINLSNIYLNTRDLDLFVVMPSTNDCWYLDTKFGFKYQTFISEELPIRLANYFPISLKREDTFIMGESMGGFGTFYTALSHPEKYGKAISLSGAIGNIKIDELLGERKEYLFGSREEYLKSDKYLLNLVSKVNDSGVEAPELFAYCGYQDPCHVMNEEFVNHVAKNCPNIKLTHHYTDGKHDFFYWNKIIPSALADLGFELDEDLVKQI